MKTYEFTAPDGKTYAKEVDDNVSASAAWEELQTALGSRKKPKVPDYSKEVYDPTEGMSGLEKFGAGAVKSVIDTGRGIGQLIPFYDNQAEIDEAKRLDEPLMNTGAGMAGNIAGNIGMVLAPGGAAMKYGSAIPKIGKAVAWAGKNAAMPTGIIPSALSGGLLGFTQPVASDESRANKTMGGLLFGGAIPAIGAGFNTAKTLGTVWTDKFAKKAAGRVLNRMSNGGDDLAARIGDGLDFADNIEGYNPTLGEVLSAKGKSDPGIATFQSVMEAADPVGDGIKSQLKNRVQQQDTAILNSLDNFMLDDVGMSAAEDTRRLATKEIYDNLPFVQSDEVLERILGTPAVKKALPHAKEIAGNQYRPLGEAFDTMEGLSLADDIAETLTPKKIHWTKQPINFDKDNILTAIRKKGGISKEFAQDTYGNKMWEDIPQSGLFRNEGGNSLDDMAGMLVDDGYLPEGSGLYELTEALYGGNADTIFSSSKNSFDDIYAAAPTENSALVEQMQRLADGLERKATVATVKQSIPDSLPQETGYWGRDLQSIKQGLNTAIEKENSGTLGYSRGNVLGDYKAWLDDNLPGLKEADDLYSKHSQPINESNMISALRAKDTKGLIGTANDRLQNGNFLRLLENEKSLLNLGGNLGGKTTLDKAISKPAREMLDNVASTLRTRNSMLSDASAKGSNTAQNLIGYDLVSGSLEGLGLPASWAGGGFLQNLIEKPLSKIALSIPESKIKAELAEALINPAYAQGLLDTPLQRAIPREIGGLLGRLRHPAAVAGGLYVTE